LDDEPEALTAAEILEHHRIGLQLKLAAAEKVDSEEFTQHSPKFAPRLLRIHELAERKSLEEVLGGWKPSVAVISVEEPLSTEDDFSITSSSDSDSNSSSSTPSTPTSQRYTLFDSPSPRSSPAPSVSSLPLPALPAEHADIAKLLFTSTSTTSTFKVDYRSTSRIPRLTLKSSTSTIGLGLGLSLPHDFRFSAEQVFGPFRPQHSASIIKRNIYLTSLIPSPIGSTKRRPSPRRSPSSLKLGALLTSLPRRVFPTSRIRYGRVGFSNKRSIYLQSIYRRGRCGVPVRRA
jgi:hypothetical protein